MTISTYSELKTAIASWMHRSDTTTRDDEAIDNFEAKVNRRLRVKDLETTTTGNMVAGTATISFPTANTEIRSITYVPATGAIRKLEYIALEQADALEFQASGLPQYYTTAGNAIRFYPTPDSTYAYTIKHYQRVAALSSTTGYTTNWLLSNNPDLYLYGSLVELCAYTGDDPRLQVWKIAVEEGLNELIRADRRERFKSPQVQFDPEIGGRRMTRDIETDGE